MLRRRAILLGSEANFKAESGDYYGAIDLYSKAIEFCPYDYRFYLNRAFCYEKTELYHLCLADSEEAIRLNRSIEKCYLRKARALVGLKEYSRAEETYHLILQMNSESFEAKDDLIELRFRALRDMGFDKQTAMKGSTTYETIRSAIDGLLSQSIKNCYKDFAENFMNDSKEEDIENNSFNNNLNNNESNRSSFDSNLIINKTIDNNEVIITNGLNCNDFENKKCDIMVSGYADKARNWASIAATKTPSSSQTTVQTSKIVSKSLKNSDKPTNIWGYNGIRVERVNCDNKKAIIELFGAFGKVVGVEPVTNRKHSIWVYYDNPNSPIEAIAKTKGSIHPTVSCYTKGKAEPLKAYFAATNEQKELKFCRPKHPVNNGGECYYWRTTTCLMDNCRLLHIPVNQHIDAQIWMKDTEGKSI